MKYVLINRIDLPLSLEQARAIALDRSSRSQSPHQLPVGGTTLISSSPRLPKLMCEVLAETDEIIVVKSPSNNSIYTISKEWVRLSEAHERDVEIYKALYSMGLDDNKLTVDHLYAVNMMIGVRDE